MKPKYRTTADLSELLNYFGIKQELEIKLHNLKFHTNKSFKKPKPEEKLSVLQVLKKDFQCSQCSTRSTSALNLKAHVRRRHDRVKPFHCQVCTYSFVTKQELTSHMRRHTGVKSHACNLCTYKCNSSSHLTQHVRIHTGEKPYKCSQCPYEGAFGSNLKRHVDDVHKPENNKINSNSLTFTCAKCDLKYCSAKKLKSHMRIHREKRFKCKFCTYATHERSLLTRHTRLHTGEKPFACTLCNYAANSKEALTCHVRVHTGEKPYNCSQCQSSFACSSSLIQHERANHNKGARLRTHNCPMCSKAFYTSSAMAQHILSHTGEKPYNCEFCKKEFGSRGRTSVHEVRCQLNPKQRDTSWVALQKCFKCETCEYSTISKGHLERHVRTHTGERPYSCQFCSRRFSQASDRKKHEKLCKIKQN